MNTLRRSVSLIALVAVAACSKKQPPAPTPTPVPVAPRGPDADSARRANEAKAAAAAAAERQRLADAAAEAARRLEAARTAARATLGMVIYFDYDKDEIRDDQRAALDAKVPILNANPDVKMRIAGHTDDRGSDEYNLALGQRRAAAVRRYMAARGVAEGRFEVVSFGEQRPALSGESEDAWAKNRRAEFEITAGGTALKVP